MPRPKTPLISRTEALKTALRLIDTDGLDAFSIRRLGTALGVNGTSLYHHFDNKDDIIVGAARLAFAARICTPPDELQWREWLPLVATSFRDTLTAHPALIPYIAENPDLSVEGMNMEDAADRMLREGVPSATVLPMLRVIASYALATTAGRLATHAGWRTQLGPALKKTSRDAGVTDDDIFPLAVASIIDAVELAAHDRAKTFQPGTKTGSRTGTKMGVTRLVPPVAG